MDCNTRLWFVESRLWRAFIREKEREEIERGAPVEGMKDSDEEFLLSELLRKERVASIFLQSAPSSGTRVLALCGGINGGRGRSHYLTEPVAPLFDYG